MYNQHQRDNDKMNQSVIRQKVTFALQKWVESEMQKNKNGIRLARGKRNNNNNNENFNNNNLMNNNRINVTWKEAAKYYPEAQKSVRQSMLEKWWDKKKGETSQVHFDSFKPSHKYANYFINPTRTRLTKSSALSKLLAGDTKTQKFLDSTTRRERYYTFVLDRKHVTYSFNNLGQIEIQGKYEYEQQTSGRYEMPFLLVILDVKDEDLKRLIDIAMRNQSRYSTTPQYITQDLAAALTQLQTSHTSDLQVAKLIDQYFTISSTVLEEWSQKTEWPKALYYKQKFIQSIRDSRGQNTMTLGNAPRKSVKDRIIEFLRIVASHINEVAASGTSPKKMLKKIELDFLSKEMHRTNMLDELRKTINREITQRNNRTS
tara:strand:- start:11985 stop:13106 length:1122 start_codon:yes stop_codon:yes gene_type:complete